MRTLIVLFAILVGGTALAQPPGATPPRPLGPAATPPGPGPNQNRREKIKKRIRALRAYTLTEELSLDEQMAGKLFPVLSRYDDDFDKLLGQRADLMRKLDSAANGTDPRAVDRAIDDAVANQRAFRDLEDKRLVELRKILTPQQSARLLIVLPALERKIQNQLRNAIQGQKPKAKGGAARERDDDDDVEPDERPGQRPKQPKQQKLGGYPQLQQPGCDPFSSPTGCR
jgi:hypothetical protein